MLADPKNLLPTHGYVADAAAMKLLDFSEQRF
jgi:hypothetical protein